MSTEKNTLAISLFSEILAADQMVRNRLSRVLPKGMEISHFSVLNHLAWHEGERSPAQLAETFNITRGAMTNTLSRLEWAGYVHIRPDWDDARRKMVAISPAGRRAREQALSSIAPLVSDVIDQLGEDSVRATLPILRQLRMQLSPKAKPD
ncbi:MarR family winged helix-turn-helix transcriptional regulator [Tateyamaria pelophila]|uniref:MarR family winged helix-turn-helix transcriptional regulator n=1 Tax=Tateyamaria pelophila TaxID=328415 RepID=UPI001CC0790E|nr:MarR family winged helix-turn-helix transcriptional regulator [Tateyamaria pelophila]